MLRLFTQAFITLCYYATDISATPTHKYPSFPSGLSLEPSIIYIDELPVKPAPAYGLIINRRKGPSCLTTAKTSSAKQSYDNQDFTGDLHEGGASCENTISYRISFENQKLAKCENSVLHNAIQLNLEKYNKKDLQLIMSFMKTPLGGQEVDYKVVALPPVEVEKDLCKVDSKSTLQFGPRATLTPDHPRLGIIAINRMRRIPDPEALNTCPDADHCTLRLWHPSKKLVLPYPPQVSEPFVVTYASPDCVGVQAIPEAYSNVKGVKKAQRWSEILKDETQRYKDMTLARLYDEFEITPGLNRVIFTGLYGADNIDQAIHVLKSLVPTKAGGCRLRIRHGITVNKAAIGSGSVEEYLFGVQLGLNDIPTLSKAFTSISSVKITTTTDDAKKLIGGYIKYIDVPAVQDIGVLNVRDYRRRPTEPLFPLRTLDANSVELIPKSFNITTAFPRIGFTVFKDDGSILGLPADSNYIPGNIQATLLLDYSVHIH